MTIVIILNLFCFFLPISIILYLFGLFTFFFPEKQNMKRSIIKMFPLFFFRIHAITFFGTSTQMTLSSIAKNSLDLDVCPLSRTT